MRDIALLILLPLFVLFALRRPFLGVGLWVWTSSVNLNSMLFGFLSALSFSKVFAGLTIISYCLSKDKNKLVVNSISVLVLLFFFWVTASSFLAINFSSIVWDKWGLVTKTILLFIFIQLTINTRSHIEFLIWLFTASIGFIAAQEGLKLVASFGSYSLANISQIEGDNNFFGVMVLTILPLTFYLFLQSTKHYLRIALISIMALMVFGVLASYSRGALIGLFIFIGYLGIRSKKKVLLLIVALILAVVVSSVLPERWSQRMDTIGSADQDSSFMGRVIAWKISALIAMDNPIFGGGFGSVTNPLIWDNYAQDFNKLDFIDTSLPKLGHPKSAHSIYFQIMGDHGFVGLTIYLLILVISYRKLGQLQNKLWGEDNCQWLIDLASMLRISLIVFAVTGGLVSIAYQDFIFVIFALVTVLERASKREKLTSELNQNEVKLVTLEPYSKH
jgi:probable O-glycosylation ligase (exosortase A-associated)